jgi:ribonuclease BN (tRNA processing enzyme)
MRESGLGERQPLQFTFIGAGNAFGDARCYSGFLLNGRVLFDAPPTAVIGLKTARLPLDTIDVVLVSHFHGDHYFGLPFLLLEYAFPTAAGSRTPPRTRDLTIVGPPGIGDRTEQLVELAFPNQITGPYAHHGYRRRYVELEPGAEREVEGLRIGAARMNHAAGSLPLALGYRVGLAGRVVAYTGDSAWCDGLWDIGRGADVYVCDANYPAGRNLPEHLSLDEVRDLRAGLDPRTALILTHLGHREAPRDLPRTFVAEDQARFTFA